MGFAITVRGLKEREISWLKAEAKDAGISMEEFVRRMIRAERERRIGSESVSDIVLRYFGPEHGVELPPRGQYGYRPLEFPEDEFPRTNSPRTNSPRTKGHPESVLRLAPRREHRLGTHEADAESHRPRFSESDRP